MPSPGLLRTVCAYLDPRRLITTELYVIAPTYVPVAITLEVLAQPDADTATVEQAVEAALAGFLDPLAPADPMARAGRSAARSISSTSCAWPSVTDVIRVANLVITLQGTAAPACTDVPIPTGALLARAVRSQPPSSPIRRRWDQSHDQQRRALSQSAAGPAERPDLDAARRARRLARCPGLEWHVRSRPLDCALVLPEPPGGAASLADPSGRFGGLVPPPNVASAQDGAVWLLDVERGRLRRFD